MLRRFRIIPVSFLIFSLLAACETAPVVSGGARVSTSKAPVETPSEPAGTTESRVPAEAGETVPPEADETSQQDIAAKDISKPESEEPPPAEKNPAEPEITAESTPASPTLPESPVTPVRRISRERLKGMVRPYIPENFLLVGDAEYRPLTIYHDLDENGMEDIFLLLMEVPGGPEMPPELSVRDGCIPESAVANMSRLFSEAYPFHLAFFLRNREGLVSMYRIPLGKWFVFENFEGLLLDNDRSMPFAVSVSFQTHEGRERQLVAFSRFNSFSFFSMKNSISVISEIRDIDGDGILDIVEWRKVFEEGTGYETFLTWFKWDGTKFSQHDSTNIVRNLNSYLQTLGNLLSVGKWDLAVSIALRREDQTELQKKLSTEELILRLFPSLPTDQAPTAPESSPDSSPGSGKETAEEGTPEAPSSEGEDPSDAAGALMGEEELIGLLESNSRVFNMVFFPRVWENPFNTGELECCDGYGTRFSVRFILRDGRSILRLCTVRMSSNPFMDPQFFIEIPGLEGRDK